MSKDKKAMEREIIEHLWALYLLQKEMEKRDGSCTEGFFLTVQDGNFSVNLDFSSSFGVPTENDFNKKEKQE